MKHAAIIVLLTSSILTALTVFAYEQTLIFAAVAWMVLIVLTICAFAKGAQLSDKKQKRG